MVALGGVARIPLNVAPKTSKTQSFPPQKKIAEVSHLCWSSWPWRSYYPWPTFKRTEVGTLNRIICKFMLKRVLTPKEFPPKMQENHTIEWVGKFPMVSWLKYCQASFVFCFGHFWGEPTVGQEVFFKDPPFFSCAILDHITYVVQYQLRQTEIRKSHTKHDCRSTHKNFARWPRKQRSKIWLKSYCLMKGTHPEHWILWRTGSLQDQRDEPMTMFVLGAPEQVKHINYDLKIRELGSRNTVAMTPDEITWFGDAIITTSKVSWKDEFHFQ